MTGIEREKGTVPSFAGHRFEPGKTNAHIVTYINWGGLLIPQKKRVTGFQGCVLEWLFN